jgi:AraC family transcriptional regulator, positive regulator of tynA and feaB
MLQSDGVRSTPILDFEARRALLRSHRGGEVKVTAPNAFAGWMRPLSSCGLAAAAVKIQWRTAAGNHGCYAHQVERTAHQLERTRGDVRLNGAVHYLISFQVAGQSALTQIDQTVRLTEGDVALVDAARPATYFSRHRNTQWLSLRLPRTVRAGTGETASSAHDVRFPAI